MDILLTFAELAVAIGGFAAVIIVFKDRENKPWNRHLFSGLISHVVIAMLSTFTPLILNAFHLEQKVIWGVSSLVLGIWTIIHATSIFLFDKKSTRWLIAYALITGLFCGCLVTLNGFGIYFDRTLDAYLVGIIWHLLQAMLIFAFIMLQSEKD